MEKRQCSNRAAGVYDKVKHHFQLEYQVVPSLYQMVLPISLVLCGNDYSWELVLHAKLDLPLHGRTPSMVNGGTNSKY